MSDAILSAVVVDSYRGLPLVFPPSGFQNRDMFVGCCRMTLMFLILIGYLLCDHEGGKTLDANRTACGAPLASFRRISSILSKSLTSITTS